MFLPVLLVILFSSIGMTSGQSVGIHGIDYHDNNNNNYDGGGHSNFVNSGSGGQTQQYTTTWLFLTESQYDWFISREVTESIVSFSGGNSTSWDPF